MKTSPTTNVVNNDPAYAYRIAPFLVGLVTLGFMLLWWNRFLGGQGIDGVFYYVGKQLLHGIIPYRDYTLVCTPFEGIKAAILLTLFGDRLAVLRFAGLLERVALSVVLFLWLRRHFPAVPAMIATLSGVCVFSAASADTGFAYNHTASWYGVVAGWAAGFGLDSKRRHYAFFAALSGVFACLCFLTKQTVGLGITAIIPVIVAVAYWRLRRPARALGFTLGYAAGWMIPGAMFFGWLWRQGAWTAFLSDNFIKGPSSKGSLLDVLLRPVRQTLGDPWLTQEFVAATLLLIFAFLVLRPSSSTRERAGLGSVALVAAAMAFTIGIAFFLSDKSFVAPLARIQRIWIYVSITGAIGCLVFYGFRLLRGKWNEQDGQMLLLSAVSFAIAYMHSLSFATTEAMSIPGFAFLAALAISRVSPRPFFRAVSGPLAIAACFLAAFGAVCLKIHTPFAWYSFNEGSVHAATETSTLPQLQGLYMTPPAKTFVERITAVIRTHSGPDDPVYLFFYLPLIYGLTDRRPPTLGFNHFIDVAPDYLAEEDADRLLARKPKLFAYSMLRPNELREWEELFRAGKPSGQRHLVAVLDRLSSEYRLLDTLQFPGSGRLVKVFERTTP